MNGRRKKYITTGRKPARKCGRDEFEEIRLRLEQACFEDGQIYADLNRLILRISDYLLKHEAKARKGIGEIMGGEVLELYSERLLREGREDGIRALVNTCISFGATKELTLQKLKEEFGLSGEDAEKMLEQYWKV